MLFFYKKSEKIFIIIYESDLSDSESSNNADKALLERLGFEKKSSYYYHSNLSDDNKNILKTLSIPHRDICLDEE